MFNPESSKLGGFTQNDGTIDFYLRIRSIIKPEYKVVDLGAGRGGWFEDDNSEIRKEIRHLTPLVKEFVAIDVDEAVMSNRTSSSNMVYDGIKLPFDDNSVHIVIADYVIEHIDSPTSFAEEVSRVLKPGGFFCARTPHKWHYVSIGARLVKNSMHDAFLSKIQPGRKDEDIFPTTYKLNTLSAVRESFSLYEDHSFLFRTTPAYFFGNRFVYNAAAVLHRLLPRFLVANIFVFLRQPVQ